MKRVAVIGGGAAGLTAAISATKHGAKVTIFEHNTRVGKKILSTGNGKCNLTNTKIKKSCYRSGENDFPLKVINKFNFEKTISFFEYLGLPVTEKNGYVYPTSMQAASVLDVLRACCEKFDVEIVFSEEISVHKAESGFNVVSNNKSYSFESIIIATGGMAAPATGSDGSGYDLAKQFGHNIIKPLPSLCALKCSSFDFKSVAGVRTKGTISLTVSGKYVFEETGEIQFTNYGISGIPVFNASYYASRALYESKNVRAVIDLYPYMTLDKLITFLNNKKNTFPNQTIEFLLNGVMNKKFATALPKLVNISLKKELDCLTEEEIILLASKIKKFEVKVYDTNGFENAQVTTGGINVNEINPETMESLFVKNVYFAGEIVDVDGICGGYNLQFAWSSGYLAGENSAL